MSRSATSADVVESGRLATAHGGALRDAVFAWLAHEALVALAMALSLRVGMAGVGAVHAHLLHSPVTWGDLLHFWIGWGDAGSYAQLAAHGYGQPDLAAYYPLLPLLEHILAPLAGGDATIVGFCIANVAALPAFYLLRTLAERETGDRRVARLALVLAAFAPFGFFFAMGYTESLFLLLSLGVFAAARERRWLSAGVCAALAVLTRATGLLLLMPIMIEAAEAMGWRFTWGKVKALARPVIALALPVVALLAFWAFEARVYGVPFVAAHVERTRYARWLDWPWYGPGAEVAIVARHLDPWPTALAILEIIALLVALAGGVALVMARRPRVPLSYVVYAWAVLLFTLVMPVHAANIDALYSLPRYLLVDFPLYLAIALVFAYRRRARVALLAGSGIAYLLLAMLQTAAFAIA